MNGIINILKPPGMSSSGVVVFLRKILNEKRIGHAGTLDPGAAGVLVVLTGRCTRLSDYLMGGRKTYRCEIVFGVSTDTLDSYGTVTKTGTGNVSREQLEETKNAFLGEIMQTPPVYSAVKVEGRKSYELARKGIEVRKPPRKVEIYRIDIIEELAPNRFLMEVECSKGTYIRTLLSDIGEKIGIPAYTGFLMRVSSGNHMSQKAFTVDEIRDMCEKGNYSFLEKPEDALKGLLKEVALDSRYLSALKNGQIIERDIAGLPETFALYAGETFLGIGCKDKDEETGTEGVRLKAALYD